MKTRCEGCGADKDAKVQTAVAPERKLEGDVAVALVNGSWKTCAFCHTQASPVDGSGRPEENCRTCGAPLDVAVKEAVPEAVPDEVARAYSAPRSRRLDEAEPPAPKVETEQAPGGGSILLISACALTACLVVGLLAWALKDHWREARCTVVGRTWQRQVELQKSAWQYGSGWRNDAPVGADIQRCDARYHHSNRVQVGVDQVHSLEEDRSRCVREEVRTNRTSVISGYRCAQTERVKNGGVAVSSCKRREPIYTSRETRSTVCVRYAERDVVRLVPRFADVPEMRDHCSWRSLGWVRSRIVEAQGSADPRWPEWVETAGEKEREGRRSEVYRLQLSCPTEKQQPLLAHDLPQDAWSLLNIGDAVIADMVGNQVGTVRPAR